VLLLAWAPLVGDALCAAAGWLRLAWLPCLGWMALGKGLRYALLLWATQ
jgi:membrane protein YqaA with SNARE-associated domain